MIKPFNAQYSIDECKLRLAAIQSGDMFGFTKTKVKFTPSSERDYRYILWKTMRSNIGQEMTLAEVTGHLTFSDGKRTVITGVSRTGRIYKVLPFFYVFGIVVGLVSYLSTQKFEALAFAGIGVAFIGFTWLLAFYWRNQLEGMVERALMQLPK
jgi:hypothetical protein